MEQLSDHFRERHTAVSPARMRRMACAKYRQGQSCFEEGMYDACGVTLRAAGEALVKYAYLHSLGQYARLGNKNISVIVNELRRFKRLTDAETRCFDLVCHNGNKVAHGSALLSREEARDSLRSVGALLESFLGRVPQWKSHRNEVCSVKSRGLEDTIPA